MEQKYMCMTIFLRWFHYQGRVCSTFV